MTGCFFFTPITRLIPEHVNQHGSTVDIAGLLGAASEGKYLIVFGATCTLLEK